MKRVHRRCCGIDVHKATLTACVRVNGPGGKLTQETRGFGTTSDELLRLHDWLSHAEGEPRRDGSDGRLLETGIYVLEKGFTLLLVNPADVKRMPARKTDVSDAAWLAQLLENGLLRPSFIPPRAIRELRDLVRYHSTTTRELPAACTRSRRTLTSSSPML